MLKFILSFVIFIFSITLLDAQTFNGTGGAIPDGGAQTCFNINVTGVGIINGTYGLASVCLNINHPFVSDLEIYLKAPNGTMIPLSIQNGGIGPNYTNTCFTATATTAITAGIAPFTGNFRPEGNLGTVNNGQNANAVWSLCIQDLFTPDAGTLVSWSLLFNNTPVLPAAIPSNDDPCNAIPLTVGAACSYATYTNENATGSINVPAPGCASYSGADVWFSVTVPAGGGLIFDTQTGVLTDGGMAIYSGSCNALTLIGCNDDASNNGLMPLINAAGLTPGTTIWIRVWEYGNNNNGTFGICVTTPPPPPTNDEPCNAITLPVNITCNFSTFTNAGATGSTVPNPGCGNYQGADVWFRVIVPPGGSIIFDSNTGTMTDGNMAVYSGSCNALTLLACDDLSSANGQMALITLTGQTPGAVLWVRFWGYGTNNTGTFQLCASIPPPPTVQDCPAAIAICQNVYTQTISYSGTGSIGNEINPANSCLTSGERADVWYTFTVSVSGNLNFTITPNTLTDDYDWAVYNLTNATCSNIYNNPALNVSCNFSSTSGTTGPTGGSALNTQGAGGTPYNAQIPVIAGQTYVINVSNFSQSANGYTIDFGASTASIFDNVSPQLQSVNAASTCGGSQLSLNFSENILCNSIQNPDFSITGPGGPYTVTSWSSLTCTSGATYANNVVLTVSPALTINGNYQVCLTSASGSVTDLCGNVASPGCLNFTIASTVPTFASITPICSGSTAPALPTTSLNGFTGTWNPAIVNNTATTTYTFTPNTGQCALPTTLIVTVTAAGTVPTFAAIPPFCSGSIAPVLQTTSLNGITGTWSPATVNNTTNATYTFTPNVGQCATQTTLNVTVTPAVTPTFTTVPSICSGSPAPLLPVLSNNGISGTWSPVTVSNTLSGTYTFTPTVGQCATSKTLTITVNPLPTVIAHGTNPSCNATCDGNATVDVVGGTAPYTYSWSNAGNTQTITGLCAGTYTVTVTDANGCIAPAVPATVPGCFQIQSILVDACSAVEYDQEMVFFQVGQNSLNTSSINVTWPTAANTWNGLCTDPAFIASVNATITGGGIVLPLPGTGILPANANVVLITSTPPSSANSFANLTDTLYALFQCPGNTQGHFANNTGAAGPRTLIMNFGAGCNDTAIYNTNQLINTNGTTGGNAALNNGAYVNYSANGTATYLNYGCVIPFVIQTTQVVLVAPTQVIPTFTAIAPICSGITAPALTTTSLNGITGTWIPATVNNTTSGTYTFTPNTGQCATTTTLTVTVNPNVTSTTNTTICTNQLPYTWNGQTYATGGPHVVTLLSSAGCDSVATLNLTVNPNVSSTTNTTICVNQLPYTWNGQTYSTAGTHVVTLVSSAGCDSVATLNLTVNPIVASTTNTTICVNQLPYTWNGQTYATAGTYNVTLTSSSGCDSVATLNLSVNSIVTSTTNTTICVNQLPYTWNGQTYTTAGTYNVTLTSSSGCDSVATLNLSVNSIVTSTTNTTICVNQLPYTWNGQTYTTAGTYNVTLTSSSGCDSVATLNLTVNPIVTSTTNITICVNQLPYTWNGQTYSTAGPHVVTLVSSAGCDSVATLNLTVNPIVTSTTNTTICVNQLPYTWNGQTYSTAGPHVVTLVSSAGCDSVATLNLTVNPNVTSTTNTTICVNQLPYTWNGQTYSTAGTHVVTLVSSAGCDSVATLNLTVNPNVTSTTNTTICVNQLPYTWNGQTYTTAGTHTVTLVSSAGCDSVATLNLTVNPIVSSTTNTTICVNQLPYTWNGQTYSTAGTHVVTLISSAGCDSVATLNLTVNPIVTSTTNTTICVNQLPYTWNGQTYTTAGTHAVTLVSSAGCDSVATLNLTVNPIVTSTTNTTICVNQLPYTWNGQTYSTAGTHVVTLVSSAGCDSVATLNLTVNPNVTSTTNTTICVNQLPYTWNGQTYSTAGTHAVTLVSSAGCDSVATLNLTVNPIVSSTTNTTICVNQLPYTWNGQTYSTAGTHVVTLVSSAGCDSVATLNLTVNPIVTSTTNTTICVNQLPYTWNGQTYSTGGSYNVSLLSSSGCDSVATLNLSVNSTVTSTTNTTICVNQLPYTWNGQTYATAGTHVVTLVSSAGCDSVATLNLTVNPIVTSTTNTTICVNQLPYTWNGQTYSTGGSYNVSLLSSSGCDSVATLNLSVNSTVTSTTNTTICTNQLPYTWNGQTYATAGTYNVTLTSSSGCDSVATLNLAVNTIVTSTTNTTICVNQLPYTWNGQTYATAGTHTVTLVSSAGCDSVATLNLTVNSTVTSTTNTTICVNQLPYTWNGQTYSTGGSYNVTLTSSSGCDSIATLNLSVNSIVTSTTNTTICTNQLPYTWNGQTYSTAGTYNVTLTSSSGCDSIATLNLTVNSIVTSTTNTTICVNQLPYTWNGQTYTTAGTYNVTLTSSSGCDSVATLNLTVNSTVTSTTNTTICVNQLPYTWNGQTYSTAGTHVVTLVSSAGCDSVATLNLTVNPIVASTTNTTICVNQLPYTWNGQTYATAGTYNVTLTSSSGCDSVATLNLSVNSIVTSTTNTTICVNQLPYTWNGQTYTTAGTYNVTLTSSSGCDSVATLNLSVNSIVTSTTNTTICVNQLPYTWNGQTYTTAGTYNVTLTSSSGCDSVATLNLTVNPIVTSTTNITICVNQLPYTWNGQTYSTAGPHVVTLVSSAGCDSVATLNLTVNPIVTSTTNTTICVNQLPYTWNGQTYSTAGPHVVTLVSSAGCDSVATLNLTVNPNVTSTTNTTICVNQLPYTWNGQTYSTAGTHVVTLVSSAGCDSVATLNLTVNPNVTSTTNTTICVNQLPYTWNGQTYTTAGTHTVTLVSSAGCDSVATLNLTVNPIVSSTTNTTICVNQLPYTWNGQTYSTAGTHVVTLISSAGCDSVATLNLTVNPIVTSTTNTTICVNQLPYTWNGQTYTTAGTYNVTLTSSSGCDSVATLNLSVNSIVTSTTNTTICVSQLPYTWNGQTYTTAGTHVVTLVSSAGCDSVATLNLTVNPIVTSTTNTTICVNQLPYTWNGQTYTTAGPHVVTLLSSAGCDSVATLNLTVNPIVTSTTNTTICVNQLPYTWNGQTYTTAGPHVVTLLSSAGCDSVATLNLTVNPIVTSTTNITICVNQLPYTWNGQTYTTAGPHVVTLLSSAGCDSVATLNLTVNPIVTSTTNITICVNQLPYTWNGQTYTTAGPHVVTLLSSAGCDSVATLNLTVNPIVTSTTNITICVNQLPYTWNGQTYTTAGPHVVTLLSSAGCDSVATLNLTVNPIVTSTTNITICSNQLPYLWNGQSYSTGGPHVVTLVSSAGCDSVATLNLTVNPVVSSITNITTCSNQLPYLWNGQSYITSGLYTITLLSTAGCDSITKLNLVVNPVKTSLTNISTCNNQLPYNWNGQSYSGTGIYTITLTSSAGCDSIATLNLTVNPVVSSTTNASICNSLLPYVWNGQSYLTSGAHVVTLISSAGCDSIATLNLTINQTPTVPTVTSPINYCQYSVSSALSATGTNQLLWYSTPSGGIGTASAPIPFTNVSGITNYYVSQTNGICESPRAMITVKVNGKPALGADQNLKICYGNSANLISLYNTIGLTSNWTFNQAPVNNPTNITTSGIYQLVVSNTFGCIDTAVVTLTIQPPVVANAGLDGNAELNAPYQLHGSGGVQYLWSPAFSLNNAHIADPIAILTEDTRFILMVMDEVGCTDYDTVHLRVFKGPTFYVPTAFTPNGDGLNDIFRPTAVGIANMDYFRVYDRYGVLVYETNDLTKGWDGKYKGVNQNTGNYVWTIKATDRRGELKIMKGYVVLIR